MIVVVSFSLEVRSRFIRNLDLHASFLSHVIFSFFGLLCFFLLVFIFNLPLKCLFYRVLFKLLLLIQYRLFISSLENGPSSLQLKVQPTFEDLTSCHNLREIALCLHCILIHVGTGKIAGLIKGARRLGTSS